MKLTINDKYMIITDQYNFILHKYSTIVNKKDKSERKDWIIEGYFPSIQSALNRILQEDIRDLDEANIHMILDAIKNCEKSFKKSIKDYQLQKDRVKEKEDK
jgi:DNA topoisomerase VI subunit B